MNSPVRVLENFGVSNATLRPLENTQNTNHAVTTAAGERYLLRQHRAEALSTQMLESELIWLAYLRAAKLEGQRPVALPSGNFVLEDETGRFSLLTWLEGEVLETIDAARAMVAGAFMARLHEASAAFEPPVGFTRPRYDPRSLEVTLEELRNLAWLRDDLPLFERSMARASAAFIEGATPWGLIHADLHSGNMIWQGSGLAVIDFDRCGFGPLGFDISTALGYLEDEARAAFLDGYKSVLPSRMVSRRSARRSRWRSG
ncbi:MAG: phosphotransferase [Pleurocapsa sp. SU_196_0]|nr:phosphotransferase [Pleurocapsa sp. SU_196_0]